MLCSVVNKNDVLVVTNELATALLCLNMDELRGNQEGESVPGENGSNKVRSIQIN